MTNKNYSMLPVFIALLLIPHLLFWWLAPLAAIARLVIYLGATVINFAAIATLFTTYWKCGLRKTAGLAVASGILETATFIACGILLAINATIRSAAYLLVIVGLIHLIVLIPMVYSIFKPERIAVSVLNGSTEETVPVTASLDKYTHPIAPSRNETNNPQIGTHPRALPPRNR